MRRLLTRSWLATHALAAVLIALFLLFGLWQLHRAEAGNGRSWAYSMEWPSFALIILWFWAKIVWEALHQDEHGDAGAAADASEVAGPDDDPELAAYNRYIAELAERRRSP